MKTYQELAELDYGYRLLTAFRFWNMIEYFFPSKYLIERPWDDVLPEYIQRMASLPDGDYTRTMWRMIAEIKDSHANWGGVYKVFGYNRVPLYTAIAEGKLIVSRPDTACYYTPKGAGFHVGDEIVAVNGRPVSFYMDLARTYIPCSNEARVRDQTADIMLRTDRNTQMRIHYCRDGIERDTLADIDSRFMNMERRDYVPYMDFGEGICYVNSGEYRSEDEAALISLFGNAKGLLVDLRNYPSPDFKILAMNSFLPDSLWIPLRSRYTYPELSLQGTFHASAKPEKEWQRPCEGEFPLVVSVDGWTQSAGEDFVQYLQIRHDVTVVGNQTAGANGNVACIDLPGNIRTCFSGLGWYYNDGREVQRKGVRIDHEVHPTIEGIKAGKDEILEAAIKILKENISNVRS